MANIRYVVRLLAFAGLLSLVGVVVAPQVNAQDDNERLAVIGLEQLRSAEGATVVPIRVTVQSRRAVDATLEIQSRDTNLTWQLPLALAGSMRRCSPVETNLPIHVSKIEPRMRMLLAYLDLRHPMPRFRCDQTLARQA